MPEVLAAADELAAGGHRRRRRLPHLAPTSCSARCRRGRASARRRRRDPRRALPADARARRSSRVLDGHPHTLAFLGGRRAACRSPASASHDFGQSGDVEDLYRHFGIDAETIVGAAPRPDRRRPVARQAGSGTHVACLTPGVADLSPLVVDLSPPVAFRITMRVCDSAISAPGAAKATRACDSDRRSPGAALSFGLPTGFATVGNRPATGGDRSATTGHRHATCVSDPVRCGPRLGDGGKRASIRRGRDA